MVEIIAILGSLATFAFYQAGLNKESDRRMDDLRIDLNDLGGDLKSHIHVSAANQETLEEKINSTKSIMNHSMSTIDEKINILTGLVNQILKR
jgi:hypothetical protein